MSVREVAGSPEDAMDEAWDALCVVMLESQVVLFRGLLCPGILLRS